MTTTLGHLGSRHYRTRSEVAGRTSRKTRSISLSAVGLVALVVSAWGGIVPFVGPTFGFSADGAPSWHWDLSHAVLAVVPGAVGCLVGLSLLAPAVTTVGRRRVGLGAAGLLAIAAGAWFVIGPSAWPVISDTGSYFVSASPLRELEYAIGYSLGPGLILAMAGAFAWGWGARHNRPLEHGGTAVGDPAQVDPGTRRGVDREPVTTSPGVTPSDVGPMPKAPPVTFSDD